MAAIKKRSLVDQVYEMLRGDIITLRRPLGSKLNVNELQDELGVSCTPIREAVNRLQQEGLVVYENNVGAHILDLDQHDITEIEQLAMTLHCAAIRLAMAHGDRAAIVTGLEKYLEEYRRARNVQSEVMAVNRQSPAGCEDDLHTGPAVAVAVYLCRLPYRARQPRGGL